VTMTSEPKVTITPPQPDPSRLTAFFWEAANRHELHILRCENGHYVHYPRLLCDRCQTQNLAPEAVSGRATLYSYTWTVQAFHPYWVDKLPYLVAVVELVEQPGLRLTTNIVDCPSEDLKVGMELQVTYREVAPGLTLPMFRPVGAA
jgi:uncharacterized protein